MEATLVPEQEPGGEHGAQESDEDQPGDAQHPGQDAVLPLVANRLGVEIPPGWV